ncbi:hypothetical protein AB0880_18780 [Micromonospora chersina]
MLDALNRVRGLPLIARRTTTKAAPPSQSHHRGGRHDADRLT